MTQTTERLLYIGQRNLAIDSAKSWRIADQAIEEALRNRMITVAEDLKDRGELEHLTIDLSCLEDTHDQTIMEIGWDLQSCCHAETLETSTRERGVGDPRISSKFRKKDQDCVPERRMVMHMTDGMYKTASDFAYLDVRHWHPRDFYSCLKNTKKSELQLNQSTLRCVNSQFLFAIPEQQQ